MYTYPSIVCGYIFHLHFYNDFRFLCDRVVEELKWFKVLDKYIELGMMLHHVDLAKEDILRLKEKAGSIGTIIYNELCK